MTTYCILDVSNNVVTTFANSQLPTTQTGYVEIPIDGGQPGQKWDGSSFVAGPVKVPQQVTAYQAKLALSNAGLYTTIDNYISASGTQAEKLAWQYQQTYERPDVMLNQIMAAIGQTSTQVDQLFINAFAIVP